MVLDSGFAAEWPRPGMTKKMAQYLSKPGARCVGFS
jgi:hypothetical protein